MSAVRIGVAILLAVCLSGCVNHATVAASDANVAQLARIENRTFDAIMEALVDTLERDPANQRYAAWRDARPEFLAALEATHAKVEAAVEREQLTVERLALLELLEFAIERQRVIAETGGLRLPSDARYQQLTLLATLSTSTQRFRQMVDATISPDLQDGAAACARPATTDRDSAWAQPLIDAGLLTEWAQTSNLLCGLTKSPTETPPLATLILLHSGLEVSAEELTGLTIMPATPMPAGDTTGPLDPQALLNQVGNSIFDFATISETSFPETANADLDIRLLPPGDAMHTPDLVDGATYMAGPVSTLFVDPFLDIERIPALVARYAIPGEHLIPTSGLNRYLPIPGTGSGWGLYAAQQLLDGGKLNATQTASIDRYLQKQAILAAADAGMHHIGWSVSETARRLQTAGIDDPDAVAEAVALNPGTWSTQWLVAAALRELVARADSDGKSDDLTRTRQLHRLIIQTGPLPMTTIRRMMQSWTGKIEQEHSGLPP